MSSPWCGQAAETEALDILKGAEIERSALLKEAKPALAEKVEAEATKPTPAAEVKAEPGTDVKLPEASTAPSVKPASPETAGPP